MKKKKLIWFLVVIVCLIGIYSAWYTTTSLSYSDYKKLFMEFDKDFKPDLFERIASATENSSLVAIEQENSFGKRAFLTNSKQQDFTETQKRIEYSNDAKDEFVTIDLVYLNKKLDKDLAFVDLPIMQDKQFNIDEQSVCGLIKNRYEEYILTYKNMLVVIKIFSKNEDENIRQNIMKISKSVVKYISEKNP